MYFGFNNFIIKNVSCRPPSPNNILSCSNPFSSQFLTPFSSSSHFPHPIFTNIFPAVLFPFSSSSHLFFSHFLSSFFSVPIHFLLLLSLSLTGPTFSLPSHTLLSQFPSLFLPVATYPLPLTPIFFSACNPSFSKVLPNHISPSSLLLPLYLF